MSFEIQYTRDGEAIKDKATRDLLNQQADAINAAPEIPETPINTLQSLETVEHAESTREEPAIVEAEEPVKEEKTSPADRNWRLLREQAERAERERDEAIRLLQETKNKATDSSQESQEEEPLSIDEDALVEGKHLKKLNKYVKSLEQKIRQTEEQTILAATEAKIRNTYHDFDRVVNADSIESLKAQYPEIAHSIAANNDMYSKAVAAYTFIKKMGIVNDTLANDKRIVTQNAAKPRPVSTISPQQGESPLTRANAFAQGLTDDLQKQLYKEMQDAMRNR